MGKPKIRFKGFTEEWEQRKAVDIAEYSKGNGYSKSDLTEIGTPIILYGRLYTKYQFAINEVDTFAVPKEGAVYSQGNEVIIPASGETAEDIARASAVEKSGVLLGGDLNILRPFDFINPLFLAISISSGEPQKELAKRAQGKSVVHIHNSDLQEVSISYPTRTEQDQIVAVFRNLDNLITLHQRKCDETKKLKKYMLQKMFPQNGMKVPEIRFEGFTGAWEQRKVKEFIDEGIIEVPMDGNHGEKHPTASEYVNNGIPFLMASDIHNGEVDINYCKYITRERAEKLDKGFAKNGDVLITHKATIGETAILQGLEEEYAVLTPQVTYYRIRDEKQLNRKYLYAFFNSEDFQNDLKKKAAQSTRPYIGISAQQNLMISLPQNRKEQKQIGEYFFSLDHLITLHQRKCDELMKIKKYMLQNMFV
jgi:type I restriction enzyme S subunit